MLRFSELAGAVKGVFRAGHSYSESETLLININNYEWIYSVLENKNE
jgi:hypothetical protein